MTDNPVAKRLRATVDDTSSSGWTDVRRLMLEAADEIERLCQSLHEARGLIEQFVESGVEFEDPRIFYKVVQVDVDLLKDARKWLEENGDDTIVSQ